MNYEQVQASSYSKTVSFIFRNDSFFYYISYSYVGSSWLAFLQVDFVFPHFLYNHWPNNLISTWSICHTLTQKVFTNTHNTKCYACTLLQRVPMFRACALTDCFMVPVKISNINTCTKVINNKNSSNATGHLQHNIKWDHILYDSNILYNKTSLVF